MRKILLLVLVVFFLIFPFKSRADEYDDITKQLNDLKSSLDSSKKATATNEKNLTQLNAQLTDIKNKVASLGQEIVKKEAEVKKGEEALTYQQKLLNERAVAYYKNLNNNPASVIDIMISDNISASLENFFYQKFVIDEDRRTIIKIVLYVKNLDDKKKSLQAQKLKLDVIKTEVDAQSKFLAGEVTKSKKYEAEISGKISELSAKQQAILSARSGSFSASIGNVEYDDYNASKEFSPGFSPAFAAFSIGAYTHRKGMSQYGARARAEEGKNYRDILAHYYPNTSLEKKSDLPGSINVDGVGEISLEDKYLLGIAEMPSNWHPEALKSQAVAARTYALYRIGWPSSNRSICTSQDCQVYSSSKADNPPQAWKDAVEATKGEILMQDGKPVGAFYSSTAGGYLTTSGWDTKDGGSSNFLETAYEKIAKSPWFYKGWYRENYSNSSASCGRSHPWLNQSEMADILNAWIVRDKGSSEEVSRILPITIGECSFSGASGSPYSIDDLASIADKYGGRVNSVTSASVSFSNDGSTANVTFSTNKGDPISISGSKFKEVFNLRAPGYISIRNALFSIEKK